MLAPEGGDDVAQSSELQQRQSRSAALATLTATMSDAAPAGMLAPCTAATTPTGEPASAPPLPGLLKPTVKNAGRRSQHSTQHFVPANKLAAGQPAGHAAASNAMANAAAIMARQSQPKGGLLAALAGLLKNPAKQGLRGNADLTAVAGSAGSGLGQLGWDQQQHEQQPQQQSSLGQQQQQPLQNISQVSLSLMAAQGLPPLPRLRLSLLQAAQHTLPDVAAPVLLEHQHYSTQLQSQDWHQQQQQQQQIKTADQYSAQGLPHWYQHHIKTEEHPAAAAAAATPGSSQQQQIKEQYQDPCLHTGRRSIASPSPVITHCRTAQAQTRPEIALPRRATGSSARNSIATGTEAAIAAATAAGSSRSSQQAADKLGMISPSIPMYNLHTGYSLGVAGVAARSGTPDGGADSSDCNEMTGRYDRDRQQQQVQHTSSSSVAVQHTSSSSVAVQSATPAAAATTEEQVAGDAVCCSPGSVDADSELGHSSPAATNSNINAAVPGCPAAAAAAGWPDAADVPSTPHTPIGPHFGTAFATGNALFSSIGGATRGQTQRGGSASPGDVWWDPVPASPLPATPVSKLQHMQPNAGTAEALSPGTIVVRKGESPSEEEAWEDPIASSQPQTPAISAGRLDSPGIGIGAQQQANSNAAYNAAAAAGVADHEGFATQHSTAASQLPVDLLEQQQQQPGRQQLLQQNEEQLDQGMQTIQQGAAHIQQLYLPQGGNDGLPPPLLHTQQQTQQAQDDNVFVGGCGAGLAQQHQQQQAEEDGPFVDCQNEFSPLKPSPAGEWGCRGNMTAAMQHQQHHEQHHGMWHYQQNTGVPWEYAAAAQQQQQWWWQQQQQQDEGPEVSTAAGGKAPSIGTLAAVEAAAFAAAAGYEFCIDRVGSAAAAAAAIGSPARQDSEGALPSNALAGWPNLPLGPQAQAAAGLSPMCSEFCRRPTARATSASHAASVSDTVLTPVRGTTDCNGLQSGAEYGTPATLSSGGSQLPYEDEEQQQQLTLQQQLEDAVQQQQSIAHLGQLPVWQCGDQQPPLQQEQQHVQEEQHKAQVQQLADQHLGAQSTDLIMESPGTVSLGQQELWQCQDKQGTPQEPLHGTSQQQQEEHEHEHHALSAQHQDQFGQVPVHQQDAQALSTSHFIGISVGQPVQETAVELQLQRAPAAVQQQNAAKPGTEGVSTGQTGQGTANARLQQAAAPLQQQKAAHERSEEPQVLVHSMSFPQYEAPKSPHAGFADQLAQKVQLQLLQGMQLSQQQQGSALNSPGTEPQRHKDTWQHDTTKQEASLGLDDAAAAAAATSYEAASGSPAMNIADCQTLGLPGLVPGAGAVGAAIASAFAAADVAQVGGREAIEGISHVSAAAELAQPAEPGPVPDIKLGQEQQQQQSAVAAMPIAVPPAAIWGSDLLPTTAVAAATACSTDLLCAANQATKPMRLGVPVLAVHRINTAETAGISAAEGQQPAAKSPLSPATASTLLVARRGVAMSTAVSAADVAAQWQGQQVAGGPAAWQGTKVLAAARAAESPELPNVAPASAAALVEATSPASAPASAITLATATSMAAATSRPAAPMPSATAAAAAAAAISTASMQAATVLAQPPAAATSSATAALVAAAVLEASAPALAAVALAARSTSIATPVPPAPGAAPAAKSAVAATSAGDGTLAAAIPATATPWSAGIRAAATPATVAAAASPVVAADAPPATVPTSPAGISAPAVTLASVPTSAGIAVPATTLRAAVPTAAVPATSMPAATSVPAVPPAATPPAAAAKLVAATKPIARLAQAAIQAAASPAIAALPAAAVTMAAAMPAVTAVQPALTTTAQSALASAVSLLPAPAAAATSALAAPAAASTGSRSSLAAIAPVVAATAASIPANAQAPSPVSAHPDSAPQPTEIPAAVQTAVALALRKAKVAALAAAVLADIPSDILAASATVPTSVAPPATSAPAVTLTPSTAGGDMPATYRSARAEPARAAVSKGAAVATETAVPAPCPVIAATAEPAAAKAENSMQASKLGVIHGVHAQATQKTQQSSNVMQHQPAVAAMLAVDRVPEAVATKGLQHNSTFPAGTAGHAGEGPVLQATDVDYGTSGKQGLQPDESAYTSEPNELPALAAADVVISPVQLAANAVTSPVQLAAGAVINPVQAAGDAEFAPQAHHQGSTAEAAADWPAHTAMQEACDESAAATALQPVQEAAHASAAAAAVQYGSCDNTMLTKVNNAGQALLGPIDGIALQITPGLVLAQTSMQIAPNKDLAQQLLAQPARQMQLNMRAVPVSNAPNEPAAGVLPLAASMLPLSAAQALAVGSCAGVTPAGVLKSPAAAAAAASPSHAAPAGQGRLETPDSPACANSTEAIMFDAARAAVTAISATGPQAMCTSNVGMSLVPTSPIAAGTVTAIQQIAVAAQDDSRAMPQPLVPSAVLAAPHPMLAGASSAGMANAATPAKVPCILVNGSPAVDAKVALNAAALQSPRLLPPPAAPMVHATAGATGPGLQAAASNTNSVGCSATALHSSVCWADGDRIPTPSPFNTPTQAGVQQSMVVGEMLEELLGGSPIQSPLQPAAAATQGAADAQQNSTTIEQSRLQTGIATGPDPAPFALTEAAVAWLVRAQFTAHVAAPASADTTAVGAAARAAPAYDMLSTSATDIAASIGCWNGAAVSQQLLSLSVKPSTPTSVAPAQLATASSPSNQQASAVTGWQKDSSSLPAVRQQLVAAVSTVASSAAPKTFVSSCSAAVAAALTQMPSIVETAAVAIHEPATSASDHALLHASPGANGRKPVLPGPHTAEQATAGAVSGGQVDAAAAKQRAGCAVKQQSRQRGDKQQQHLQQRPAAAAAASPGGTIKPLQAPTAADANDHAASPGAAFGATVAAAATLMQPSLQQQLLSPTRTNTAPSATATAGEQSGGGQTMGMQTKPGKALGHDAKQLILADLAGWFSDSAERRRRQEIAAAAAVKAAEDAVMNEHHNVGDLLIDNLGKPGVGDSGSSACRELGSFGRDGGTDGMPTVLPGFICALEWLGVSSS